MNALRMRTRSWNTPGVSRCRKACGVEAESGFISKQRFDHKIENGVGVRAWSPALPAGTLEKIYLHWSGGDYTTLYPAYHFCVASLAGSDPRVYATHPLEENMRDLRMAPDSPYAAHTRGRNSFAIGLSVMCMEQALSADFGRYPLTVDLIDGLCRVAKVLADFYRIPVKAETIMTHAEAACIDGYFGSGEQERWDIARLQPSQRPLVASDALAVGAILRAKIENY